MVFGAMGSTLNVWNVVCKEPLSCKPRDWGRFIYREDRHVRDFARFKYTNIFHSCFIYAHDPIYAWCKSTHFYVSQLMELFYAKFDPVLQKSAIWLLLRMDHANEIQEGFMRKKIDSFWVLTYFPAKKMITNGNKTCGIRFYLTSTRNKTDNFQILSSLNVIDLTVFLPS